MDEMNKTDELPSKLSKDKKKGEDILPISELKEVISFIPYRH